MINKKKYLHNASVHIFCKSKEKKGIVQEMDTEIWRIQQIYVTLQKFYDVYNKWQKQYI